MNIFYTCLRQLCTKNLPGSVCIVGAGPAGFYAAQQILKSQENVKIDILEQLPVPYGLVRFGVAPDHPEVKNVIHTFEKTAKNPRVQFFGNVNVGRDVSIEELKQAYHAVLLTYGSEEDRLLNVPGEELKNVVSAKRLVGWYNGVPSDKDLKLNLNTEDVVVLGQGNVAIDVARVLLSPVDKLKETDITSYSLEQLSESKVKRVWLVGRRGPLQAAFTIAELREMLKLENCRTIWRPGDFEGVREVIPNLKRPRKRITELMLKSIEDPIQTQGNKEFRPVFLRSPLEFLGNNRVQKIMCAKNRLVGEDVLQQSAQPTDETEIFDCELSVRSIGYKSVQIDPAIPFNYERGRILNSSGKVGERLYGAGWAATGPVGVILSTMTNAFQVGKLISQELVIDREKEGSEFLKRVLEQRNIQIVSYGDWEKIDAEECRRGKCTGRPREKIVEVLEMLEIAKR